MRILESQRHKLLDELEKCPSSGDEKESPKKRPRYSYELEDDRQSHHNYQESSTTNCNGKVLDHRDSSSSTLTSQNHQRIQHDLIHRKTVEIRRLSDCNIKHSASVPGGAMTSSINHSKNNRRPSTDSLTRYQMDSYLQKRRKTSATNSTSSTSSSLTYNENENHSTKNRNHHIHSNNSFEASGGESDHGSRPGTPLCDERPDHPMDPRGPPTPIVRRLEPMILPLPKFAQHFHHQLRLNNQLLPASTADKQESSANYQSQQSSLSSNRSTSPSNHTQSRSRSNSLMPPASRRSSTSETVTSPPQPSLSASSDSEQELVSCPGSSPSLEERLKKLTEDYDSWSSNGRSSSSSQYVNNYRHSVPEIAVPETPILLKMVAKNSMFDEDSKRLENVNDKYIPPIPAPALVSSTVTSKNAFAPFSGSTLGNLSPMLSSENVSTLAVNNSIKIQQPVTISTMIHQRLGSSGTGSPLNSPNTASPYNSPNPSSASSISSVKGLQYPFPSHQAHQTPVITTASATATSTSVTSVANCLKPKSATPALGKSLSLPETQTSTTPSTNNNSSNLNVSCNKSSTNNLKDMHNVNSISSVAENTSKLLVKSVSVPNNSSTDVETITKNDEKLSTPEPIEDASAIESSSKKDVNSEVERKNHSKDKRKASENDNDDNSKKEKEVKREKEAKKVREPEIESKKVEEKKSKNHKRSKDEHHHTSSSDDKRDEGERAPSPIHEPRKRCVSFEDVSSVDSSNEQHTTTTTASSKETKHTDKRHHNHTNHKKSSKDKSHDDEGHSKTKDSIFDELKRNSKDNIIKSEKVHKSKKHHHHHHSHRENSLKDKENQTHNDTSAAEEIGRSSDDEIHLKHHRDEQHKSQHRQESSEESSGKKKTPRSSLNNSLSTDDSDDSQDNKKSIFDIPDDSPFISMYDKVKARSCKNLKKLEDEKKIKDKFTALKQSRAKRDQKRLNSSDDDTDSDANENGSHEMFKFKSQMSASEEDERMKSSKKSTKFSSMCEEESSEGGITDQRKRSKVASRKLSRTNVIDSSDEDMAEPKTDDKPDVKSPAFDFENDSSKNHKNSKKRHYDKAKEDKPSKKSKKVSRELHRKSSSEKHRNEDKMEEIFGPISDDDVRSEMSNVVNCVDTPKKDIEEVKSSSDITTQQKEQQKEESRKRKEKRRREREKQRAIKEEENSVDFDEAGRVLEAQLMSDSDHKTNNNDHSKDSKSDDVFRFTDGDDEMKRDHHDNSNKKKKKKKRAKGDRKHHHNHHHFDASTIKEEPIDNTIESSGAFNNNNNTKLRLDVMKDDVTIKPSVPSLIEDLPPVTVNQVQIKKEVKIPGFGSSVDEKVHEKAVLSIAQELEKKTVKIELLEKPVELSEAASKTDTEKVDEKSRVVISQKETADAVAALLGESFSMSNEDDYCDPYDVPIVENESQQPTSTVIAPEEDEEMKKAIMSLNSEIDPKPDTPQSEHDLQIDTDNDEPHDAAEEDESMSQSFDNPPKTPDVDMTQLEKVKKESTPEKLNISGKSDDSKTDLPNIPATPNFDISKEILTPVKSESDKKVVSSFESRFHVPPSITIPPEPRHLEQSTSPSKHKQASPAVKSISSPNVLSPRSCDFKSHESTKNVEKNKSDEKIMSPSKLTSPSPPQSVFSSRSDNLVEKSDQQQWQVNSSSVIQKAEPAKLDAKKHSEVETSHDEEEDDAKRSRGSSKQQKGRKATPPMHEESKSRAAKASGTPKRGGRGVKANSKSAAQQSGNRQQKNSESDVYEFHDDSGDEISKSSESQRQRLVVTIKSSTVSPTTTSTPVISTPSMPTNVVTSTPASSVPIVCQEVSQETLPQHQHFNDQVPSPAPSNDDFTQPNNNTRKSMRLLEKDGTRTSVDDTIDDVIRNVALPGALNNNVSAAPQATVTSRRTTRQSTPASIPTSQPPQIQLHHQQPTTISASSTLRIPTAANVAETKKPSRAVAKKHGKDRKTSENSETEISEKKVEVAQQIQVKVEAQPIPISSSSSVQQIQPPTQQQQSQVIVSQIPIKNEPALSAQVKKESSELLQLIDPVTGEMQKMTQSKEGQYVPVPENRGTAVHHLPTPQLTVKQLPPQFTIELKNEEKKPVTVTASQSMPATIVKVAPTLIQEPTKSIPEQTHVVKPVITQNPTYSKPPQSAKTYVLGPQNVPKSQIVSSVPSVSSPTVISSQGMIKVNPQIVQHPSTIYNLPNIIPTPAANKQISQQPQPLSIHQKTIVLPQHQAQPPTIIHQNPSASQIVHQKLPTNQSPASQIVIQSQPPTGNLMINIPQASASQQQSMHSPRLQLKQQVIQRPLPSSQHQQQASPTTVVMKAGPPMPHDQKIIQTTKVIPETQSYISGGREIIYVGGNIQKQTIYPNYHSSARTLPVQAVPKPQQIVQPVPHSPKIVASQPSVSVTQIQIPPQSPQSQKVYLTNSGQVITSVPSSQDMRQDERQQQQWIPPHEKVAAQPQPMKARYMMESHEDSRIHADRVPHQAATLKRSYVIEGAMPHQVSSQSIPPQNKTVIGLNQSPQILTGAVASPPLAKAHISTQQPIVTGKSSD